MIFSDYNVLSLLSLSKTNVSFFPLFFLFKSNVLCTSLFPFCPFAYRSQFIIFSCQALDIDEFGGGRRVYIDQIPK